MSIDAVSRWLEEHPAPNQALFSEGGRAFSPRVIAEEIARGTDLGKGLFFGMTTYLQVDSRRAVHATMKSDEKGLA